MNWHKTLYRSSVVGAMLFFIAGAIHAQAGFWAGKPLDSFFPTFAGMFLIGYAMLATGERHTRGPKPSQAERLRIAFDALAEIRGGFDVGDDVSENLLVAQQRIAQTARRLGVKTTEWTWASHDLPK